MKHLFAAAAIAPLCFAATAALAQTSITTSTTTALSTSSAKDIDVAAGGTVQPASGTAAITVDSNNNVTVEGTVLIQNQPAASAVLITGDPAGRTSNFTMTSGLVRSDDTNSPVDTDKDGDLDGPYVVDPAVRYGLRVTGPGTFTGNISSSGGLIASKGNSGSAAVSIETPMVGNISLTSTLGSLGTDSYSFHSTAPITGNILFGGTISSIGQNAIAVGIDAPVTGSLKLTGALTNTGFRYPDRPIDATVVKKLDADDLLIGGPAVSVTSSITGGLWLYKPPAVTYQSDGTTVDTTIDTDGDGLPDAGELTASAITQSGSAPAILIGGANPVTLGNVGSLPITSYGAVIDGTLNAFGVYDGISAKGIQIGGQGGAVDTSGGVRVAATLAASATYADVTDIQIGAGATVPKLQLDGAISAGALGDATRTPTVRGVEIDAGASVPTLNITGSLRTGLNGPEGHLTTVLDNSGTLTSITQEGVVSAQITTGDVDKAPVGEQIAFDLRANTSGVTLVQQQNPDTTGAPTITGDILFGSGNADLEVTAGSVLGAIAFGTGSNTLNIASGTTVSSSLTNAGTQLNTTVNGALLVNNAVPVAMTSLTTGSDSTLGFTVDPQSGASAVTQFNVAGTASLGAGTKISVGFKSKLPTPAGNPLAPTSLTVINAAGGLIDNGYNASLEGESPYLYAATSSIAGNQLQLQVRRKSEAELGLLGARGNAFQAFYDVFDKDAAVQNVVLSKSTQSDFNALYNQFLPDYSGGPFNSMVAGIREVMRAQAEQPVQMDNSQPRSWLQEVGFGVNATSTTSQVQYQTAGFAVAGGYEQPAGNLGTVGYSATLLNSDIRDQDRAFGSKLSATSLLGSVYWRKGIGGLVLDASAMGGYALFDSNRRVVDQSATTGAINLVRNADGNWSGGFGGMRIGAAYEADFGPLYIRPEALLDYMYLYESGYHENGGGAAVNLTVNSRSSTSAEGEIGLVLGGRFGQGFHWGPEIQVAYRALLSGQPGSTTAAFTSIPTNTFLLPALAIDKHRLLIRLALRGTGQFANFTLEGSGEFGDLYDNYTGRLVVRFLF